MSAAEPNKTLLAGKYHLVAQIARGGMADVFLAATQSGMGGFSKLVVVKVLRQNLVLEHSECVQMFLDEARIVARLNHPNVVQAHEVGEDRGRYYLAMQYLEGQTLDRIANHSEASRRFSMNMRLQVLTRVLAGLQYAHDLTDYDGKSLGIVHRDISPSNISVTYDGHTKLVDFGIAKARGASSETASGMFKGKTRYMAPEQIVQDSEIDRRADIYAVGVVLWELLAGARMWKGLQTSEIMRRVLAGHMPALRAVAPTVPPELERICMRALAHSPDHRYPTAAALEADLEAYLGANPPRRADRDIGAVLKDMFATDRATIRAAIERSMRVASDDTGHLPALKIDAVATGTTSSVSSLSAASLVPSLSAASSIEPVGLVGLLPEPPLPARAGEIPSPREQPRAARRARALVVTGAVALQLGLVAALFFGWSWFGAQKSATAGNPAGTTRAGTAGPRSPLRGVTDTEVLCGMSAVFSGSARELGNRMKLGVETAFEVVNDRGGVAGRKLKLVALDDGYEGTRAGDNMKDLLDNRGVFAVIGNVGTPTSVVAAPIAVAHKTLFFGAFTGSKILRQVPPDRYVFNYRASYEEETSKMVHYLVDAKKVDPSGIVVFAQHDSYGDAGFEGVAKTMRKYGKADSDILRVNYERNTADVDAAVRDVVKYDESHRVGAVVMVATYKAAARFIQKIKDKWISPTFLNVSFVGSNALMEELRDLGPNYAQGVIVTQVVPHYESGGTGVLRYREALSRYHPDQQPDFVSLEGYVVGTIFGEGLRRAGRELDTEKLVDALESIRDYDMGIGTIISYGLSEHQGSHKVWGTMMDGQGHFQSIEME